MTIAFLPSNLPIPILLMVSLRGFAALPLMSAMIASLLSSVSSLVVSVGIYEVVVSHRFLEFALLCDEMES